MRHECLMPMVAMSAYVMWDTVEMDSPVLVCYASIGKTCIQPVGSGCLVLILFLILFHFTWWLAEAIRTQQL